MDLSNYSIFNLEQTIADDRWSVRDEVLKRNAKLAKKIAKARNDLAKMEAENAALLVLYNMAT